MKIVSIGEVVWDVFEDSERLGGAPFNFSVHAGRLGHDVAFVSAVGDDDRGRAALALAQELGLSTEFIQTARGTGTGIVSVRVDSDGQPDFTIHRPAAYDALQLNSSILDRLGAMQPDWLYFGTLHQANPAARTETQKLADALPGAKRLYDMNLRRDSYTRELIAELMAASNVVKLNEDEASAIGSMFGCRHESLSEFTEFWWGKLGWDAVAVTSGSRGCAIRIGNDYAEAAGYPVRVADTVGAGDAFAAAFVHGLSQGWDAMRTGDFANRVGASVVSRPGGVPMWSAKDLFPEAGSPK